MSNIPSDLILEIMKFTTEPREFGCYVLVCKEWLKKTIIFFHSKDRCASIIFSKHLNVVKRDHFRALCLNEESMTKKNLLKFYFSYNIGMNGCFCSYFHKGPEHHFKMILKSIGIK